MWHSGRYYSAHVGWPQVHQVQHWTDVPTNSAAFRRQTDEGQSMTTRELQLGAIGQISRTVRDIDAACAWYGDVLGLKHLYTFGKLAFFDCGGIRLYLSESDEPQPESVLYLRVADIGAAYAELITRGVEFKGAPHLIYRHPDGTEEWMAFFKDLEGRFLALMSQIKP
jgi:catechol 2,3-dioxygenase-like lactoylglutathione lyase family enzyme